jgi:hypothetical protein
MAAERMNKGQASLDEIRGQRLVHGAKMLAALEEMGLIPANMTEATIRAHVAEPVTISWKGMLTGKQTATLLGQLELVDRTNEALV